MKAVEKIAEYNLEHPNEVEDTRKLKWLRRLEQMIVTEMIFTHEVPEVIQNKLENYVIDPDEPEDGWVRVINPDGRHTRPKEYDMDSYFNSFDFDTELLIDEPYDAVYLHYIDQMIALSNDEIRRYNTAATLYDNAMATLQAYWNRTNMPVQGRKQFLRHDNI